jgi:hypothetical protein
MEVKGQFHIPATLTPGKQPAAPLPNNYQYTLRNIPEEQRPHLHRGGSLKSRNL